MEKINWLEYQNHNNAVFAAYRLTCTNLLAAVEEKDIKLIECTGLSDTEGKNAIVAGLAVALAQAAEKVLLVDCNFSSPVHNILFDLPNTGIKDCLASGEDLFANIQHCGEQPNLDLLTGGTADVNAGEILMNSAVRQFLEKARSEYDYILLDAPPVGSSVDAIVAAPQTDGVLLVLDSENDKLNPLLDARKRLEAAGATVLGCVLDKVKA